METREWTSSILKFTQQLSNWSKYIYNDKMCIKTLGLFRGNQFKDILGTLYSWYFARRNI